VDGPGDRPQFDRLHHPPDADGTCGTRTSRRLRVER
jgi:hypothetical protein